MWRTDVEIATEHAEADKRVGGVCGCAACCIVRHGLTREQHAQYRRTGKWPKGKAFPQVVA
jgi:hypothetical protein